MAEYQQRCLCRGKAIAIGRDIDTARQESANARLQAMVLRRHLRAASHMPIEEREELSIDVLGWMRESEKQTRRALRLEIRLAALPSAVACSICTGTGIVTGNGSAAYGGVKS